MKRAQAGKMNRAAREDSEARTTFRLSPRGPYSLEASASFLCGFTPGKGGSARTGDGRLVVGLLDEQRLVPVAVALAQPDGRGEVLGEIAGRVTASEASAITRQLARILSLDHDATGLAAVGERDPAVRAMLEALPGFRPVCFPSPYEAAIWGVLAQRISMTVAASIKQRLAIETGSIARGFGHELHPAPAPAKVLALESFPGIAAEKLTRLKSVALAALEGKLDAEHIRSLCHVDAVEELQRIRGVGPWTAEHIVMRGCGALDELPLSEPRVLRAIAESYGLRETPSREEALHIAEGWRPYRMWIAVLMVMNLRRSAPSQWNGPEARGGGGSLTSGRLRGAGRPSPIRTLP